MNKIILKENFQTGDYFFNEGEEFHSFHLIVSNNIEFKTYQISPKQDFSIRMWLSYEKISLPEIWGNNFTKIDLIKYPFIIKLNLYPELDISSNIFKKYIFNIKKNEIFINFQNLENSKNGYRIIV